MDRAAIEKWARELVTKAIVDNLADTQRELWADPDPYARTSEELSGIVDMLSAMLDEHTKALVAERKPVQQTADRIEYVVGETDCAHCGWGYKGKDSFIYCHQDGPHKATDCCGDFRRLPRRPPLDP